MPAGKWIFLTASVLLRYLALCGEKIYFPVNAYQGEYVVDIARQLYQQYHNQFVISSSLFKDLPLDEPEGGDKEIYIDAPDCTC